MYCRCKKIRFLIFLPSDVFAPLTFRGIKLEGYFLGHFLGRLNFPFPSRKKTLPKRMNEKSQSFISCFKANLSVAML